jgi:hypothetical protein
MGKLCAWGEPIGLLPARHGLHTVYFAHLSLARLGEQRGKLYPLGLKVHPNHSPFGSG